jgi:uncharacterized cupin superfamily protein
MLAMAAIGAAGGVAQAQESGPVLTEGSLGKAKVFSPEGHITKTANGAERWSGFSGTVNTGEAIGLHYSVVPAGTPAVAPHKIMHSELLAIAEGTVELWADGVVTPAPAGSVIYVAYGTSHFLKNVGEGPARYFVFQVGGDTKKG